MKLRSTVLVAVATVVALAGPVAGTAAAATHSTREGLTIELTANRSSVRSIAPLDGMPLSKQARLSSDVHAAVQGVGDKKVEATVEVGYQIGYPVALAPDGVDVTLHTPELTLSSGINAKLGATVGIGADGAPGEVEIGPEIGAELGAEATVIPSADLEFAVKPGGISTVSVAEFAMTKPVADTVLSGVDLHVTNALGPVSVRPYAKITVTSEEGVYVYHTYGKITRI